MVFGLLEAGRAVFSADVVLLTAGTVDVIRLLADVVDVAVAGFVVVL